MPKINPKKKGGFQYHPPYLNMFINDWSNCEELRKVSASAKGVWIDLIFQMAKFFPYGHCSTLNYKKLKASQNPKVQEVIKVTNPPSNPDTNDHTSLKTNLAINLTLEEQLELCDNMEDRLHAFLPYGQDVIAPALAELEDEGVCSRHPQSGILYSRRMLRDFNKKINDFLNGKKGGNPAIISLNKQHPKDERRRRIEKKRSLYRNDIQQVTKVTNPPSNPPVGVEDQPAPGNGNGIGNDISSTSTGVTHYGYEGVSKGEGKEETGEKKEGEVVRLRAYVGAAVLEDRMNALLQHKGAFLHERKFLYTQEAYRELGIDPDGDLDDWLDRYHSHCFTEEKVEGKVSNYHDYKTHFRNWIYNRLEVARGKGFKTLKDWKSAEPAAPGAFRGKPAAPSGPKYRNSEDLVDQYRFVRSK